jgi:predicted acylesterase/phospholipase RssA
MDSPHPGQVALRPASTYKSDVYAELIFLVLLQDFAIHSLISIVFPGAINSSTVISIMLRQEDNPQNHSENKIKIGSKRKIAFVCSGGATKAGAFHLGVALALKEQGFKFLGGTRASTQIHSAPEPMEISTYVGSSAGSIISSYLAAGYSLENIFSSFLGKDVAHLDQRDLYPKRLPRLTYQKMFKLRSSSLVGQAGQLTRLHKIFSSLVDAHWEDLIQFKWLKVSGLFSTAGIEQYMREEVLFSNQFQDYLADLFIVATQLDHSRKVVFGKYNFQPPPHDLSCQYESNALISDACAASTALPVIFSPHLIKTQDEKESYFIDGEIRDTLSSHVAVDNGADLVIASYTHQPYHLSQELGSLTNYGLPSIVIQSIYLVIEQKINNHIYNKQSQRNAISSVSDYCKSVGLSEEHRRMICNILEKEFHHRMDVDTIYIHPKPTDSRLFFGEHFSLSPKKMAEIVRSGFHAAIDTLKKYEFEDRKVEHAIGSSRMSEEIN